MTVSKTSRRLALSLMTAVLFAVALLVGGAGGAAHGATSTPPDFNLPFDGNLNNSDPAGPATVSMGAGTASYVTGVQGQPDSAINLDDSDYVQLEPSSALIDYTNSWSIAYWVNINSYNADSVIVGNKNWDSGANPGYAFNTGGGDIKLNLQDPSSARQDIDYGPITTGQWTYVAATFDYSAGTVTAYLNGQEVQSVSVGLTNLAGYGPTLLGQGYSGTNADGLYNNSSTGTANNLDMADFVMSPGVLSASQISTMYSSTEPSFTVTNVNVGPQNVSLQQGTSYNFTAIVTGTNNPAQNVDWSVSGENSSGTTISPAGTLTIAPDETATTLTVTATSQYAPVSDSATVTVIPDRSDGDINFGVVADMHTTVDTTTAADARATAALDFLSAPAQDNQAIFNVGDLQSDDTWPEYVEYQNLTSQNATVPLYASMGEHENADYSNFTAATGDPPNYVENIDGYTFIMLSAGDGTLNTTTGVPSEPSTTDFGYLQTWLQQQIATAEAAAPDKPIFVFRFNPIPNTLYQSEPSLGDDDGTGLENLFTGDSHIVLFTAEAHNPNNDPLSIWQDGGYTAVNVPATVSAELQSGEHSGSTTPFAALMSQGLEVSATSSGEVDIKTRDFLANQYVQDWSFNVNDPLPYTMENRLPGAEAPVFPSTDTATLSDLSNTSVDITFPQATEPANSVQDGVYDYQYTITNDETGKVEQQYHDWNPYWITPLPSTVTEDVTGLSPSTQYTVQICGMDYYQIVGTQCLSTTFTTAAYDTTPHQLIDYALPLNGNLDNDGLSPDPVMLQVPGSDMSNVQNYTTGNDGGEAIELDPTHVVQLDPTAGDPIDYGQSFTVAFWMNTTSVRLDGQPGVLSNRNVDSDDNTGWDFRTDQESDGQVWLQLEVHPVDGTYQVIPLAQITNSSWTATLIDNDAADDRYLLTPPSADWMHVAATFNYATNEITCYINGVQVAQITDDLAAGIGGVPPGEIQSTLLGSSPWTYTDEYGGYNGSGTDEREYITLDVDDFVLASTVYTPAQIVAEMNDFNDRPATYTVTYNTEGGDPTPPSQTVFDGVGVTEPAPPYKAGYTFVGWYTAPAGGTEWDFTDGMSQGVTANTTLYAQYASATTVTSSGTPSVAGSPFRHRGPNGTTPRGQVTYTATVNPAPDGGTVAFTDNGKAIRGCTAVAVTTSTATCTVVETRPGGHNIAATFSGVAGLQASTSPVMTQVVTVFPCKTLARCDLAGLDLKDAQLSGDDLDHSNLTHANLDGADLSGADLEHADLMGANLDGADLSGADLAGAYLWGANLTGANLSGANLTGAFLLGTRLDGANLSGANLTSANLSFANLDGAEVSAATTLTSVVWFATTCPDGTNSDADGWTCANNLTVSSS